MALRHVLVIDDEPSIREMVTEILGDEGYQVATAANGLEAVEYLADVPEPPCLILLDLMMPIMDGWEFSDRQHQDARLASIPVVVVSADANVEQKAGSVGAAGFLRKPVQLAELLRLMEQYCGCTDASREDATRS